jgi:hypothetical protein
MAFCQSLVRFLNQIALHQTMCEFMALKQITAIFYTYFCQFTTGLNKLLTTFACTQEAFSRVFVPKLVGKYQGER